MLAAFSLYLTPARRYAPLRRLSTCAHSAPSAAPLAIIAQLKSRPSAKMHHAPVLCPTTGPVDMQHFAGKAINWRWVASRHATRSGPPLRCPRSVECRIITMMVGRCDRHSCVCRGRRVLPSRRSRSHRKSRCRQERPDRECACRF